MVNNNLQKLQQLLSANHINGLIFSTDDEFNNEYVPKHNERIKFLTNFSGSTALCIVLQHTAAIFVDGRYTIQAKNQVNSADFSILDYNQESIVNFLQTNLPDNGKIACINTITSIALYKRLQAMLTQVNCSFVGIDNNLIDSVWHNRPVFTPSAISMFSNQYSGLDYTSKINLVTNYLNKNNMQGFFVADLPSICWLLNIRANDVEYNLYLLSCLYITNTAQVTLFCYPTAVTTQAKQQLNITFADINTLKDYLNKITNQHIGIGYQASMYHYNLLVANNNTVQITQDPIIDLKAQKNEVEIANIKHAHVLDGIALTKLLYKLHANPSNFTEVSIAQELINIKQQLQPTLYTQESFPAIVGINGNGAIVHYHATADTSKNLTPNDYLLLDCGSQYLCGTTDVTRSVSFASPSNDYKKHFTLVLKGLIALSSAIITNKCTGANLDILARQFLWQHNLDYMHSTGHGVGMHLGVHEGPISIGLSSKSAVLSNMVFSIEPGFYKEDNYGIRLENLVLVQPHNSNFLQFIPLTMVPFDCKNIDTSLLTNQEKEYINNYHALVKQSIFNHLSKHEQEWFNSYTTLSN